MMQFCLISGCLVQTKPTGVKRREKSDIFQTNRRSGPTVNTLVYLRYFSESERLHITEMSKGIDLVCTQHRGGGGLPICVHST